LLEVERDNGDFVLGSDVNCDRAGTREQIYETGRGWGVLGEQAAKAV